jgi:hypothetical protein
MKTGGVWYPEHTFNKQEKRADERNNTGNG